MSFRKQFDFARLGPNDDIFKRFDVDSEVRKGFKSFSDDKTWQEVKAQIGRLKEDFEKEFSFDSEEFTKNPRPSTSKSHSFFQQEEAFNLARECPKQSPKQNPEKTSKRGSRVHYIPVEIEAEDSQRDKSSQPSSKPPPCPSKPKEHRVPVQVDEGKNNPTSPLQKSTTIRNFSSPNLMGSSFGKFSHGGHQGPSSSSSSANIAKTSRPTDPMKLINDVNADLDDLKRQVGNFPGGNVQSKEYRYLDEMLTRCILRLDNIDTCGKESVRNKRKNVIQEIQICLSLLESKVCIEPAGTEIQPSHLDTALDNSAIFGTVIALPLGNGDEVPFASEDQKVDLEQSLNNKLHEIHSDENDGASLNLDKPYSNHLEVSKALADSGIITETEISGQTTRS